MEVTPPEGTWDFDGRDELESILEDHGLEKADICLIGSISLSARGLRKHNDIDFVVRSDKRDQIDPDTLDGFVGMTVDRYVAIELSDDELIEEAQYHDVIDGFKVVRPEITFSYKQYRDQPKDERDVEQLKEYSLSTDDWDWSLYRSDYSQRPSTLLSRGLQSLRSDGLYITIDKVLGLITRKYPQVRALGRLVPFYDLTTPLDAIARRSRELSGAEVLNRQYDGDEPHDYLIAAYWAVLDAQNRNEAPPFDESKLPGSIPEAEPTVSLSLKHRALDPAAMAATLREHETVDASFRFARNRGGDPDALRELGFTDAEIDAVAATRRRMLEATGSLFYAILWPPAGEYFHEMENKLGEKVDIIDSEDVEIGDIVAFTKAVYDAQAHPSPEWSIDWKSQQMTDFEPVIRFIRIELPNPRIRDGISREMEMIKNDVRHAFMDHFPDEYYLSLIHASDSYHDNRELRTVVEAYRVD